MPELPEVETIRRGLSKLILNKKIVQVDVFEQKSFLGKKTEVVNAKIISLRRRGKALIFDLSNENSFLVHLRMTGQLIYQGQEKFAGGHPNENFVEELPNKQTRVVFGFSDDTKLFFNDQRKFGFVKVLPTAEIMEDKFIKSLAKEPWEMDEKEFYEKLQRHKNAPIKAVILDQKIICGLGNIYADEALFFSGINPKRKAGSLTREEAEKLVLGARTVMERSLEAGGSTIRNYVKSDGSKGDYLELFAEVFNREGKPCKRCGEKIVKTKVSGRGTHFCPNCQREQGEEK